MFQEDIGLVAGMIRQLAREIAKEEIALAIKELTPKPVVVEAKAEPKVDPKVEAEPVTKKGK